MQKDVSNRFIGFVGPSYTIDQGEVDSQRLINMYIERHELNMGKEGEWGYLCNTPGLRKITDVGVGPLRSIFRVNDAIGLIVSGSNLYRFDSSLVFTLVGTLLSSIGYVSMSSNGIQVMLVDGSHGYIYTIATGVLEPITDPDFKGSHYVDFIDGYFILTEPNSSVWYVTAAYDGSNIDALEYTVAEAKPDNIVRTYAANQKVYVFGSLSLEVFYNSGTLEFPFTRISGAVLDIGLEAAGSVASAGPVICWLGKTAEGKGIIYKLTDLTVTRISTHAVEREIQKYSRTSDASAYMYQLNGHTFYVLNFTTANTTWVCDIGTGLWHEQNYLSPNRNWSLIDGQWETVTQQVRNGLTRHRGNYAAFIFDKTILTDYHTSTVYILDSTYTLDDTTPIIRLRSAPYISEKAGMIEHKSFRLDVVTGEGVGAGEASVELEVSNDLGQTWFSVGIKSLGSTGQRAIAVTWYNLGCSEVRAYRIKISDPIEIKILGAYVEAA